VIPASLLQGDYYGTCDFKLYEQRVEARMTLTENGNSGEQSGLFALLSVDEAGRATLSVWKIQAIQRSRAW